MVIVSGVLLPEFVISVLADVLGSKDFAEALFVSLEQEAEDREDVFEAIAHRFPRVI